MLRTVRLHTISDPGSAQFALEITFDSGGIRQDSQREYLSGENGIF
jgi:hypothetical protein